MVDSNTDSYNNLKLMSIEEKLKNIRKFVIDDFKPGFYVDALDENKKWCVAQIIDRKSDFIKIHYDGWSSKYDEVRRNIK